MLGKTYCIVGKRIGLLLHLLNLFEKSLVDKWFALPTSDDEVPGSNLAEDGIQLMTVRRFTAQNLSLSPFCLSQYDFNNVERDIKDQTIIISHLFVNFSFSPNFSVSGFKRL